MASSHKAQIASVLRWLGSAVLNISRKDRVQALLARSETLVDKMNDLYKSYQALLQLDLESEVLDKISADVDQAEDLADQIREAVGTIRSSAPVSDEFNSKETLCLKPGIIGRLPKLDLPHFDGNLCQWVAFINLFDSLVHSRQDLTSGQKLAYLLASLTGEAKGLVQHLELIDNNYDIARQLLMRRYQNVRRLADNHVASILNLPNLVRNHNLRTQLLNPLLVACNALKGLNLPVDSWSFILLHIILQKLSLDMRNRFEQEYGGDSSTHLPVFDELVLFLEDECRRQDNVPTPAPAPVSSRPRAQPIRMERRSDQRVYNVVAEQHLDNRCLYCKAPGHSVISCHRFLGLRFQARRNIARQRKWCYGCLGNHLAAQCNSSRPCRQCDGNHHIILCGNRNGTPPPAAPVQNDVDQSNVGQNDQWTGGVQVNKSRVPGHTLRRRSPPHSNRRQARPSRGGGDFLFRRPRVINGQQPSRDGDPRASLQHSDFVRPLNYAEWPRLGQGPSQYDY